MQWELVDWVVFSTCQLTLILSFPSSYFPGPNKVPLYYTVVFRYASPLLGFVLMYFYCFLCIGVSTPCLVVALFIFPRDSTTYVLGTVRSHLDRGIRCQKKKPGSNLGRNHCKQQTPGRCFRRVELARQYWIHKYLTKRSKNSIKTLRTMPRVVWQGTAYLNIATSPQQHLFRV